MHLPLKMNLNLLLTIHFVIASANSLTTNGEDDVKQIETSGAKRIISRIFLPRHKTSTGNSRSSIIDLIRSKLHHKQNVALTSTSENFDLSSELQHDLIPSKAPYLQENDILKLLARSNEDKLDSLESSRTAKQETELNADILSSLLENINVSNINADGNKIRKGKLIIYYDGDKKGQKDIDLDKLLEEKSDSSGTDRVYSEIIDLFNKYNISIDIYRNVLVTESAKENVTDDEKVIALLNALYKNALYGSHDPRALKLELTALMHRHHIKPSKEVWLSKPTTRSGSNDIYDDTNNSLEIEDIINNILNNEKVNKDEIHSDEISTIIDHKNNDSKDFIDIDDIESPGDDLLNIILTDGNSSQTNSGRNGKFIEIPDDIDGVKNKKVVPLNELEKLIVALKKKPINNNNKDDSDDDGKAKIIIDIFKKLNISDSNSEDNSNGNSLQPHDNYGLYSSDLSSLKHLINIALKEPHLNKHWRPILSNKPLNQNLHNIRGKPFIIYVVFPRNNRKEKIFDPTEMEDPADRVDFILEKIESLLKNRKKSVNDKDSFLQKIKDLLQIDINFDEETQEEESDNKIDGILQHLIDGINTENKKDQSQEKKNGADRSILQIIDELYSINKDKKSNVEHHHAKLIEIILQLLKNRKNDRNDSHHETRIDGDTSKINLEALIALLINKNKGGKTHIIDQETVEKQPKDLNWLIKIIEGSNRDSSETIEAEDVTKQTDKLIKNVIQITKILKAKSLPKHRIKEIIERMIQKGLIQISSRSIHTCTTQINKDLLRGIQKALQKYA